LDSLKGPASRDGEFTARVIVVASFLWLGVQLWTSAPFPWTQYVWDIWKLNATEQRSLHLGFALFLAFLTLRSTGQISRTMDWVLAFLGASAGSYIFLFYDALAARPRAPTDLDILISGVGLLILIETVRRTIGRIAALILLVLTLAAFIGSGPITGTDVSRFLKGIWLTTEGVFGLALGLSASLALLSMVLGAVADKLGFASQLPQRFVGWMNRRRTPHKTPLVVPEAFDGHLAKWIMAFIVLWELRFTLVPIFRSPTYLSGTLLRIDFALILAVLAVALSVFFRTFIRDSKGNRIAKRDPHSRLLVWWGCLFACLVSAVAVSVLSDLAFRPLSELPTQHIDPGLRIFWPLAGAALFALILWARPAKSATTDAGLQGVLSFWVPWAIYAWFDFAERTSSVQAAFWASLASLMIVVIAFASGSAGGSESGVRRISLAAGLAGLSLAVADAARATVYVATFAALWGVLIYYFVALPGLY
jgi:TRAP-type uncharacterized transport system fused permease subunit